MKPKWICLTRKPREIEIDWELILAMAVVILLIVLAVLVFVVGIAKATSCLTMDVQPNQVVGNYDGDTFTISLGALGNMIVRVEGVDTPERTKHQARAEEAKAYTQQWLAKGPFKLNTCFTLTLGRVVGNPSRDGRTLAQDLLAAGLVKAH